MLVNQTLPLRAKTPERHAQYASQILVSARRMSHMINDILELARVRLGSGIVIQPAPTCIRQICESVVEEMQAVFPKRAFQLKGDDELPGEWDENRLNQMVSNLVGNALRYTPGGGRVDVSCGSKDGHAFLEVADTGPGIPAEERERVFDRFYRRGGDGETGSGLGLAIVRTIADRHEAKVSLADSESGGLQVRVVFPRKK